MEDKDKGLKLVNRDSYPSNILFPAKRMLNFPKLKLQSEKQQQTKEKGVSYERGSNQEFELRNSAFQ